MWVPGLALTQPRVLCRVVARRGFAYEDTLAFRLHGPKPRAIVLHPVIKTNARKPKAQVLWDAEEAVALARSARWDILPGPTVLRGGWDQEALGQAELVEKQLSEQAALVPEGWHLDRGDEESDDEYDVREAAWQNEVIRRQYAETCLIQIRQINPNTFFGRGQTSELALFIADNIPVKYVFVNTTLTPNQTRSLELLFNNAVVAGDTRLRREEERMNRGRRPPTVKVLDRHRIILELFLLRAQTPTAKVQVGLARLEHMKSRLTIGSKARLSETIRILEEQVGPFKQVTGHNSEYDVWYHYERFPFETERKLLQIAERKLKKLFVKEQKTKVLHRKGRQGVPMIGIVGYTNSGKTTLMNGLTGADLKERDLLFQTLDTIMRRVYLPSGGHAILVDSIGFLQDFPQQLSAAFSLTLEDLVGCDLFLHVRDMAHPQRAVQKEVVLQALEDAGVPREKIEASVIEVWNKIDLLPALDYVPPEAIPISAEDGTGLVDLLSVVDAVVMAQVKLQRRTVSFPESSMPEVLAFLRQQGNVDNESLVVEEGSVSIDAVLPTPAWKRWRVQFSGLLPKPSVAMQPGGV